jgi:hypothetical protein
MAAWMWETCDGVTMTRGFGIAGVENLGFYMENCKTDEYKELDGV